MIPILLAAGIDVTPEASVVAGMPVWLQFAIQLVEQHPAKLLFAVSLLASFLSQYVRNKRQAGQPVAPSLMALSSVLNLVGGNPHKAVRAAKAVKKIDTGAA